MNFKIYVVTPQKSIEDLKFVMKHFMKKKIPHAFFKTKRGYVLYRDVIKSDPNAIIQDNSPPMSNMVYAWAPNINMLEQIENCLEQINIDYTEKHVGCGYAIYRNFSLL